MIKHELKKTFTWSDKTWIIKAWSDKTSINKTWNDKTWIDKTWTAVIKHGLH